VPLTPVKHFRVVYEFQEAVWQILPAMLTVAVGWRLAKFRPVIVTDVSPVDAKFCCPRAKLTTGASNEKMATDVPTIDDSVNADSGSRLYFPSVVAPAVVVVPPGVEHATVEAEVHWVVVHTTSATLNVGVAV
jgi:hypothetical protein